MELHVLPLLQYIPKDQLSTYGDFARFLGVPKNSRQIGHILGHNEYPDIFPCYKIVAAGGSLGGYSTIRGLDEKRELLRQDGIIVKENSIADLEAVRWQPRWHSYFLALPLDKENRAVFTQTVDRIQKLLPEQKIVSFQQTSSPHVTLFYFGDIGFGRLAEIVQKLRSLEKRKLGTRSFQFQGFSYFGPPKKRTTGFFECSQGKHECLQLQKEFIKMLGETNERAFTPHLTLLRVKDGKSFDRHENTIADELKDIHFTLNASIIRLYAAADNQRQIPLVDFAIS